MARSVILTFVTVLTIMLSSAQASGAPPAPPETVAPAARRVSFRLADGMRVRGTLVEWDNLGLDGSFGPRDWTDLAIDDIWTLRRRLMDQENAEAWVGLGRVLLLAALDQTDKKPRATKLAERAFGRALRLDPAAAESVAEARESLAAEIQLRRDETDAANRVRLRTHSPEAAAWGAQLWPELTPEEQDAAVLTMKADALKILEQAGMQLAPVETDYFLFYTDMDRREAARWASELDVMYKELAKRFGLEAGSNIFWGKAVIFVFNDRDRFRLVEAESFHTLAPEWADGFCHPIGPKVFVSFYRQPRTELFAAVLVHETTHGFMHRYQTPRRLPTWANEGIADFMAASLFKGSTVDLGRRRKGLRWIRAGGNVNSILNMAYHDGSWPGENEVGYAIGYLMVELMIRDRPKRFALWVEAIKAGDDWEEALVKQFGVSRAELVQRFTQYYKVND